MSTTAHITASLRRPSRTPTTSFVVRVLLAAAAVVLCYQFPWDGMRYLTSELVLRAGALVGVHMHRVTFDTVLWNGQAYQYVIACCFVDVWCGAVPLLWDARRSIVSNAARMSVLFAALMALNVFRLTLSYLVCGATGGSWDLVHGIIGGLAYFAVWVWVWEHRPWQAWAPSPQLVAD